MRLEDKHDTKEKLYNGDDLERIYNLLGNARLIRWWTKLSKIELEVAEQWKILIKKRSRSRSTKSSNTANKLQSNR